ncbi:hypothetical protein LCGC14_0974440 [marine sediment metagenome]|uniref:FAR-17a/AIG1-like protein n=1 Tax=marine sediment metagenome TaxID=412755 RepID=A0A0F9NWU2_9ZZZZ|nr:MAG: hypothetical protein Lokiarch_28670 [Candidatus Lokiarchaeum sp. GC14_75]
MTDFDKDKYIYYFRIVLCVIGWISIILGLINVGINLNGNDAVAAYSNYFSYFTNQTNLMIDIWLTIAIIYANKENKPKILGSISHGAITLYITVTFLIFAIVLAPGYVPQGLAIYTNSVNHYILPIAFIGEWVITESKNKYEWLYDVYWISYPILYVIYSLIRGAVTDFYPYSFIDLTVISVIDLTVTIIVFVIFFLLLGAIYIFVNRTLNRRKNA